MSAFKEFLDASNKKQQIGEEVLRNITKSELAKKFRDGSWEAVSDLTRSGYQEVRDMNTKKRFTVHVGD